MPLKLVPGRHGSPFIYLRGSVRGIRVDESTGTSERARAEEIRIRREAELLERSIHGDSATRSFAEAVVSYQQAGGEISAAIIKELGRKKIGQVGQQDIEALALKLYPRAAPATINRKVHTPVAAVLNHAARLGWRAKPVISRPKQPAGRVRWITHEEAERLIEAAAPHLRPLVIFLLCTGARLSEALYLDWRHVDLSACHVRFVNREGGGYGTKNTESRGVPLHQRAVAALANVEWEREGAVFRRPAGKIRKTGRVWLPYEDRKGEGGGQIKTAWAGMLRRAGITDFTPHDCRHTWATWHYAANRDLTGLMELGGWKSLDMVIRYAHVNTSHLAPSIGKLWAVESAEARTA